MKRLENSGPRPFAAYVSLSRPLMHSSRMLILKIRVESWLRSRESGDGNPKAVDDLQLSQHG